MDMPAIVALERSAEHLACDLRGAWQFGRRVSTGETMEGTASFTAQPDGSLHYREAGEMTLANGGRYRFERSYFYWFSNRALTIDFDEQPRRLFETVPLAWTGQGWFGEAEHDCAADIYRSSYRFDADGAFEIVHRVSGPRKAYDITTEYSRLDASGAKTHLE